MFHALRRLLMSPDARTAIAILCHQPQYVYYVITISATPLLPSPLMSAAKIRYFCCRVELPPRLMPMMLRSLSR